MNILFLAHRVPYPPNKGEKIRTFNQIKYLSENNHSIFVCAPIEESGDHVQLQILDSKHCQQTNSASRAGPLRLLAGLLKNQALSVANFYSKKLQIEVDKVLRGHTIDVIVCTSSSMAEYVFKSTALNATKSSRPQLIMDFMDLDSDKWHQYQSLKPFPLKLVYQREAKLLFRYEQRIHRHFDACFFISQTEVDLFLEQDKDFGKVHVVANGLDTEYFQPAPQKKTDSGPILIFTGVMDYFPNVDAVVWFVEDIWPDIRKNWPDAQFIIAGMNPSAKIKAFAKIDGITVTGFVEDIRDYYNQADFFVAPFRIARGVQNKVLQAFACGLPVIGTNVACEGIDCTDQKDVLVAENPAQFLQSLQRLTAEKELRNTLRENALTLVNNRYSWAGCLSTLDSILGS